MTLGEEKKFLKCFITSVEICSILFFLIFDKYRKYEKENSYNELWNYIDKTIFFIIFLITLSFIKI